MSEQGVTVYDPIKTYCFRVATPYNTEYEFSIDDFAEGVSDLGDLQKMRINSHPLKGLIKLNGVPLNTNTDIFRTNVNQGIVSLEKFDANNGYVIDREDIPYLSYQPIANDGEDFVEFSAYDGNTWSVLMIPVLTSTLPHLKASCFPISVLFWRLLHFWFYGEGSMYFTNEQSSHFKFAGLFKRNGNNSNK